MKNQGSSDEVPDSVLPRSVRFGSYWTGSDLDGRVLFVEPGQPTDDPGDFNREIDDGDPYPLQTWQELGGYLRAVLDPVAAESTYWVNVADEVNDFDAADAWHRELQAGRTWPVLIQETPTIWHLSLATVLDGSRHTLFLSAPVESWVHGPRNLQGTWVRREGASDAGDREDANEAQPEYPFWNVMTFLDWQEWESRFTDEVPVFDADLIAFLWRRRLGEMEDLTRRAQARARRELLAPPRRDAMGRHSLRQRLHFDHALAEDDDSSADPWSQLLLLSDVADAIGRMKQVRTAPIMGGETLIDADSFDITPAPDSTVRRRFGELADTTRRSMADLAEAATYMGSRLESDRARREERYQRLLAMIASLLLAPGLLVALYGADVALPRQGTPAGTVMLISGMIATGALTAWWLRWRDGEQRGLTAVSRSQIPLLVGGATALLLAVAIAVTGLGLRAVQSDSSGRQLQDIRRELRQIHLDLADRP